MLLLVDAGNTRIKWAIAAPDAAPGDWTAHGAVPHAELERLQAAWAGQGLARAIVSNVAGHAMEAQLTALLAPLLPAPPTWFTSRAELKGLRNRYRNPTQLGSDRFAAALGARCVAPGKNLVVATCGTATTVDAVSAAGDFLGGMILPGLGLMLGALARGTAQLPQVAPGASPETFADHTSAAILSGCLAAQAGAIERACAALPADLCIVSGGAAASVAPLLSVPHWMLDNIVLVGLHAAAPFLASDSAPA
ncbi:type III pantothenate kinase [Massilia sp. NEAU-DD11]|uniref:Type III pantothenate kinase n=1 Tax=Massilia cellulosiltytica TaxID=2683234 RepID=A0A7X3G1P6_9BURK|nr:type III pantothenate kinase [Telluria cellulosilytica]MVW62032.1 type III pantothenate kinase [Telluria cellulosilytica]